MMEYGEKVTADPATFEDPQYMFLRERLKALKDGWEEVHQMWENRQSLLSQSLNLQMFNRDAKQAEVLLSSQEHVLSKDESPSNLEQAETLTKKHEALLTTMDANDDKINGVLSFAERLLQEEHYAAEKISKKMEEVSERRNKNRAQAMEQLERVRDQHLLHTFLQDCEELHDWIQEEPEARGQEGSEGAGRESCQGRQEADRFQEGPVWRQEGTEGSEGCCQECPEVRPQGWRKEINRHLLARTSCMN